MTQKTMLLCPICKKYEMEETENAVYNCNNCHTHEKWELFEGKEEILWTIIPLPISMVQTSHEGRQIIRVQKGEKRLIEVPKWGKGKL